MTTIVIKQQDEIEIFVNQNNSVTIQQTNSIGEVHSIYFWPEHAEALIAAIERVAVQAEKAARWVDSAGEESP